MEAFILVKVYRPEDYEDVADELVLEDFLGSPAGWTVELQRSDAAHDEPSSTKEK